MAPTQPNEPVDTRRFRTSWRLTFRYDGERIRLVRKERLQKIAPGTTPVAPAAGENSGAWLELVDRSGRTLFHRLLRDPLQTRAEHHSPDGRIELHVREPEPSEFTTIVPAIPEAAEAVLYSSPTEEARMLDAAREIGRYPLTDDWRGEGAQPDPTGGPPKGAATEPAPEQQRPPDDGELEEDQ